MLYFQSISILCNRYLGSLSLNDISPISFANKSTEAFKERISSHSYLVMHSEVRSEARKVKHQAWVEDNVDEKIAEKDQVEEAVKTKQNAEYKLTTNIWANILKNKIPNKFAKVSLTGTGLRSSTWSSSTQKTPPSPPSRTSRTTTPSPRGST